MMTACVNQAGTGTCGEPRRAPPAAFRPALVRTFPAGVLRRACRRARVVCLTYDDGPGAALSREVMSVLDGAGAGATFFAVGRRAAEAGDVLDEAAARGHEIACHTARHVNAWKHAGEAVADVRDGYEQLSRWVAGNGMFRPPYGKMSLGTIREIRRRGAPVGWWTIDGGDTHDVMPRLGTAAERLARDGGGVVLLHDFDRVRQRAERAEFVIRTTEMVLQVARREGIRVARLGDLLTRSAA